LPGARAYCDSDLIIPVLPVFKLSPETISAEGQPFETIFTNHAGPGGRKVNKIFRPDKANFNNDSNPRRRHRRQIFPIIV
jgi:hypothetical protein